MARKKTTRKAPAAPTTVAGSTYQLGVELTIRNAADQKAGFVALLKGAGPIGLDASALERVDTAGLQLLASVVVAARAAGREFRWEAPAPVLRDSASAVGLSDVLQLPA